MTFKTSTMQDGKHIHQSLKLSHASYIFSLLFLFPSPALIKQPLFYFCRNHYIKLSRNCINVIIWSVFFLNIFSLNIIILIHSYSCLYQVYFFLLFTSSYYYLFLIISYSYWYHIVPTHQNVFIHSPNNVHLGYFCFRPLEIKLPWAWMFVNKPCMDILDISLV